MGDGVYVLNSKFEGGNVVFFSEPVKEFSKTVWDTISQYTLLETEKRGGNWGFGRALRTYKDLLSEFDYDLNDNNCCHFGERFRGELRKQWYSPMTVSLERIEYSGDMRNILAEKGGGRAHHDFTLLIDNSGGWVLFPSATPDEELLDSFWRDDYLNVLERKFSINKLTPSPEEIYIYCRNKSPAAYQRSGNYLVTAR